MKKQYKAPSIEVELLGVSNFCAGCGEQVLELTGLMDNYECIELFNSVTDPELQEPGVEVICYNAPGSTYVVTTS